MNKRLWSSVGAVIGLLGVISVVTGPPERGARVVALGRSAAAWTADALGGLAWVAPLLDRLTWPVTGAIAGAAALLGLLLVAWRRRRPASGNGEPWRTVIQLGKQGQSAIEIAQRTGLSQDAVRIVLAPVAVERTVPAGKTFRSTSPGGSGRGGGRRSGGYQ